MVLNTVVEQPRHFCALAAQQTVLAIERAIPLVHAGPGCSAKLFSALSFCNGFQGSGYCGGNAIPCTNTGEKEVVFGGEERLRQLIKGALKLMDGDLFVVLTGCTADLIGDNGGQVVNEFAREGIPIVFAETGGFKGSSYDGHELVLEAIIQQYLNPARSINPKQVNVWASVPYQDPFWSGNLETLKQLLQGLGLEVNILFGHNSGGAAAWKAIPAAAFNLLVSPWVGVRIMKLLQEKFGTPYLHYPGLPIGARETSQFLRAAAAFAGVDSHGVEGFIHVQEQRFYHYLERAADFLLEFRYDLPGRFFVAADAFYTLAVSRFLVNELGLIPGHQFITDETPDEHRPSIISQLADLAPGIGTSVTFTPDGGIIAREMKDYPHQQLPLLIGSSWDRDLAAGLKGYTLSLCPPITDKLVLDRSYAGYSGGLRLIEDIYSAVLERNEQT
ncbi:MAG TPA: nitrogenase component 1 [Syntrophomonadaceae bacterium]|nr:nitrogenase component 1 [Syntrophomonadaceae bacterium]